MDLRALLFDVNGTLIDIETDEARGRIYRYLAKFLGYQGIAISPDNLRDRYFAAMRAQREATVEQHYEYDFVALWRTLLDDLATPFTRTLPTEYLAQMPEYLAQMYRAISRKHFTAYLGVHTTLQQLHGRYALGVVSDAQTAYAVPELQALGLRDYFSVIAVSGDYGYRKPDPRIFQAALERLNRRPDQALYVGNDMYCDVFGAQQAGMQAVFFPTRFGRKEHPDTSPDYIISSFPDLLPLVAKLDTRS